MTSLTLLSTRIFDIYSLPNSFLLSSKKSYFNLLESPEKRFFSIELYSNYMSKSSDRITDIPDHENTETKSVEENYQRLRKKIKISREEFQDSTSQLSFHESISQFMKDMPQPLFPASYSYQPLHPILSTNNVSSMNYHDIIQNLQPIVSKDVTNIDFLDMLFDLEKDSDLGSTIISNISPLTDNNENDENNENSKLNRHEDEENKDEELVEQEESNYESDNNKDTEK